MDEQKLVFEKVATNRYLLKNPNMAILNTVDIMGKLEDRLSGKYEETNSKTLYDTILGKYVSTRFLMENTDLSTLGFVVIEVPVGDRSVLVSVGTLQMDETTTKYVTGIIYP